MRVLLAGAVPLVLMVMPAFALDAGDTMQAWAAASPADQDGLLRKMDAARGSSARDSVHACLDDTAKAAGHASLPIAQVFKACSEQAARENI